jgi:hypothetical protein
MIQQKKTCQFFCFVWYCNLGLNPRPLSHDSFVSLGDRFCNHCFNDTTLSRSQCDHIKRLSLILKTFKSFVFSFYFSSKPSFVFYLTSFFLFLLKKNFFIFYSENNVPSVLRRQLNCRFRQKQITSGMFSTQNWLFLFISCTFFSYFLSSISLFV